MLQSSSWKVGFKFFIEMIDFLYYFVVFTPIKVIYIHIHIVIALCYNLCFLLFSSHSNLYPSPWSICSVLFWSGVPYSVHSSNLICLHIFLSFQVSEPSETLRKKTEILPISCFGGIILSKCVSELPQLGQNTEKNKCSDQLPPVPRNLLHLFLD